MDIALQKDDLRQAMKIVLDNVPVLGKQNAGRAICAHVKTWLDDNWQLASLSVGLFKSMHDEIATHALDHMLQKYGAHRAMACTTDVNGRLPFYQLLRDQTMASALDKTKPADPNTLGLDVIFLPGLAFDGQGSRLGRGRGCFDRCLADMASWPKRPLLVGLLLDEQLFSQIPVASHDIVLDYLCTPQRGMIKVPARVSHA